VTTSDLGHEPAPSAVQRPKSRFRGWTALPAAAWLALFFVVPVAWIGWYSLGAKPPVSSGGTIDLSSPSLDRYGEALSGTFGSTFATTLRVGLLGTALCLLVAFPLAYFLATRARGRWRLPILALVVIPFWTSFLLRIVAWRILLAPNGALSSTLQDLGLLGSPLDVLDTRGAVLLGVVHGYLPLMVLPLFVALDRVDPSLREAARDLGATRLQTLFGVTLPLAAPGAVAGSLLVFVPLMGEFVAPALLGGARGVMAGGLVASQFLQAQNWALGSAMAVVLVGVILATVAVLAALALAGRAAVRRRRAVPLP